MKLEIRPIADTVGTILLHNLADQEGRRSLKKGVRIEPDHLEALAELGLERIEVAVLGDDDVHENEAARALGEAMATGPLYPTRPNGGRVNLRTRLDGVVEVDAERLFQVNMLPGFSLSTRRNHAVVGPQQESDNVASLKIVPFAIARRDLDRALEWAAARPGILEVRPFQPGRRVAMLFVAEPAAQERTRDEYLPPTQTRLQALGGEIVATDMVDMEQSAIAEAAARLARQADLLIIAGQTSIIHDEDTTLRALRQAGADLTLSGAPVEPGNLMALAYLPGTPVLCAPGCAKGLKRNVVDLVLPRLLLGDRLAREDIAAMGLGGFLTLAERTSQLG